MTEAHMTVREQNFMTSAKACHGFEDVLSSYVRRRAMSIKDIQREWNLTDGEARGVLYGQASRATLRKIVKAGGWEIGLALLTGVIGHDLQTHVTQTKRMRDAERRKEEERDQRLVEMARDLRSVADLAVGGRA